MRDILPHGKIKLYCEQTRKNVILLIKELMENLYKLPMWLKKNRVKEGFRLNAILF